MSYVRSLVRCFRLAIAQNPRVKTERFLKSIDEAIRLTFVPFHTNQHFKLLLFKKLIILRLKTNQIFLFQSTSPILFLRVLRARREHRLRLHGPSSASHGPSAQPRISRRGSYSVSTATTKRSTATTSQPIFRWRPGPDQSHFLRFRHTRN